MYNPIDLLQMPQPSATACGKHTFLCFAGMYDYEEPQTLSVKQINLSYVLLVVYFCLSGTLCKDLLLKGSGRGALRRHCVQKCLRSSRYEQQRLAPGEGHRCLSEPAIVQHLHAVQAPAAAVPKTPPPSAVANPARARERKREAEIPLEVPCPPGHQRLPWASALVSQLHYFQRWSRFLPLIYFFAVRQREQTPVTGRTSWCADGQLAATLP